MGRVNSGKEIPMLRIDRITISRVSESGGTGYTLNVLANEGAGAQEVMSLTYSDVDNCFELQVTGDYENREWIGVYENIPADWFPAHGGITKFVSVVDGVRQNGYRGGVTVKTENYPNSDPANKAVVNALELEVLDILRDSSNPSFASVSVSCNCVCSPDYTKGPVSVQVDPNTGTHLFCTQATQITGTPPNPVNFSSFVVDMTPYSDTNYLHWVLWDNQLGPINFNEPFDQSGGLFLET